MPDIEKELADLLADFDSEMKKDELATKVSILLGVENKSQSLTNSAKELIGESLGEEELYKLETLQECLGLPDTRD